MFEKDLKRLQAEFNEKLPKRDTWDPEHMELKLENFHNAKDGDTILTGSIVVSQSEDTGSILTANGLIYCHEKFKGHEGNIKIVKTKDGFRVESNK